MDDIKDDSRYSSKPYRHRYASSSHRKTPFHREDEIDEEEDEQEEEEEEEEDPYEDEEAEEDERHGKKRKFKSLGFEFAPRVAEPIRSQNISQSDWTDEATFILLEAWGDRFLQLGRKSLRSDDWVEVANKVSQATKKPRTDGQCRKRFDKLKEKYKTEKMKVEESGSSKSSKWVYFEKMEMLMAYVPRQSGLACGLDSGEYVFMNPKVYLNSAIGLDEMKDSPENSELSEGDEDGGTSKKGMFEEDGDEGSSYKMLADSIENFGKIYEKIEVNKRKHMIELEKMRMEFHRDLEVQKQKILERAQEEIEKIRQEDNDGCGDDDNDDDDDDDEIDVSIGNVSE